MMAKWPLAKCPLAKCPLAKCLLAKCPLAKCPDTIRPHIGSIREITLVPFRRSALHTLCTIHPHFFPRFNDDRSL